MRYSVSGNVLRPLSGGLLVTALLGVGAHADLAPTPGSYDLSVLFAGSDAVRLGRVEHPTEVRTGSEGGVIAVSRSVGLLPRRCYKGEVSPEDTIEYSTHVPGIHATDVALPAGGDALVFLKQTRPHAFTLAFPFWGKLEDASLEILAPEIGIGLDQLQRDIVASTRGMEDRRALGGNLRVLHGFPSLSGDALALLRSYSRDIDPDVATGAFAALAKFGDPADLAALCNYVNAAAGAVAASARGFYNFASIANLRRRDALGALECLARSARPSPSLYAMEAIRGIGAPESVPEIIRHLDDADPTMQYLAVITLSEIMGRTDEIAPAMPTFEKDPQRFIQSWKRWWNEKGQALYPGAARQ